MDPCAKKLHTGQKCGGRYAVRVPPLDGIIDFGSYDEEAVYQAQQEKYAEKRRRVVVRSSR